MADSQTAFNRLIAEVLKSTDYMITQSVKNTTKIYDGLIVSANANGTFNVRFNNETQVVRQYGSGSPQVGQMVKVFLPQGNSNLSYFALAGDNSDDTATVLVPIASNVVTGGIKANLKEATDMQPVNIDEEGFLWVNPNEDKNFTFKQKTAESNWVIQHNLEKFPSVTVVDSAGSAVIGEVSYVDENNLTITFSAAFAGVAYLN